MPCATITILDTQEIGKIKTLSFTKDHKNKIGIIEIEVSGSEWIPIKFNWAGDLTEIISIEPGTTDKIGHEAAYEVDRVCVEIDGRPDTKICAGYTSYESYLVIGLAILAAILMLKR